MNVLFVHQNCPGQFAHVAVRMAARGDRVVFLTQAYSRPLEGVEIVTYARHRDPSQATHHYLLDLELGVLNGQATFEACRGLRAGGFSPDLVVGHAGWGEMLFVKDVWPAVPVLSYLEFFYRSEGADVGFEPGEPPSPDDAPRIRAKNAISLLSFDSCDHAVTPTAWQRSGFPDYVRQRLTVLHEGIDTRRAAPEPDGTLFIEGERYAAGEEIVTYVARNLEPYRGFHVFMRALPEILRRRPQARVLIVGGDGVSYGAAHPSGRSWKSVMLDEVGSELDAARVRFLGQLPYEHYLGVLKVSAAHVYLTYPFVLSWSCLEAMSAGCLLVGSRTQPVEEVITDGENGLLCGFHDVAGIADRVVDVLARPQVFAAVRQAARQFCIERYDLETSALPRYLALLDNLARGNAP